MRVTKRVSSRIAKAKKCSPANVSGKRSVSRAKRRKRASQALERSTTHRRGTSTKPRLAAGNLMTSSWMPCAAAAAAAGWSPV